MMSDGTIFRVKKAGTLTVLGFGDDGPPNHFYHDECLNELDSLIEHHSCQTIAFDLTRVDCLAGGLMGMLKWLIDRGIRVQILNASQIMVLALKTLKVECATSDALHLQAG